MLVRLRPYNPRAGQVLQRFGYAGIIFEAGTGWYAVEAPVARHLETIRQRPDDPHAPLAFDVATPSDAERRDAQDEVEARPERSADQAKTVSARTETASDAKSKAAVSPQTEAHSKPSARAKKS